MIILATVLGVPAFAQGGGNNAGGNDAGNASPPQQNHPNHAGQKSANRLGDWLRDHKDMPPDQQEKLLEKDPSFQKLSQQRQAELKERLRKFNNLTPAQRDRALNRMEFMSSLSQAQRKELREANQQLQALPNDRKVMVHKALRNLRRMSAQQRQQELQSERFKSAFSDQEQGIVKRLADITPPPSAEPGGNSAPK
jgi:hypothetical protein